MNVAYQFPLENIRYFYNPPGADGWPDMERINVRRFVIDWIGKNCVGAVTGRFNAAKKDMPLSAFGDIDFNQLGSDRGVTGNELLSTDLSLVFDLKDDHRLFSDKWARPNWHRAKLFDTKYADTEFSISACLWKLKVELSQSKPELFDWVKNNVLGEYEYCTFALSRRCVMGLEFESADDAAMFKYMFPQ